MFDDKKKAGKPLPDIDSTNQQQQVTPTRFSVLEKLRISAETLDVEIRTKYANFHRDLLADYERLAQIREKIAFWKQFIDDNPTETEGKLLDIFKSIEEGR